MSTLDAGHEQTALALGYYSTGLHHELNGRFAEAEEAYRSALALEPDNETSVIRLASVLALQRKSKEALQLVEGFVGRHPDSLEATLWLLNFYQSVNETGQVLRLAKQITVHFPEKTVGWLQLASALLADDAPPTGAEDIEQTNRAADEVVKVLKQGIAAAKPPLELQQALIRIQLARAKDPRTTPDQRRQFETQCIEVLQDIIRDNPGDLESLFTLGALLVQHDRFDESITVYEKIDRLQPSDLRARQRMAIAYLGAGNTNRAIETLEQLAQMEGGAQVHNQIADLYLQGGNLGKAAEHFRLTVEGMPANTNAWLRLAAIQAETGDNEAAIQTLETALTHLPDHPMVLEVMAVIRLGQNRYTQAARLFQQIYETSMANGEGPPPSPLFFYNYAVTSTHLRRTQEAADWLQQSLAYDPKLLVLYFQRSITGTATFRKAAVAVLRELIHRSPDENAALNFYLANLYLSQERPEPAVKAFEAALQSIEKHPLQAAELLTPVFYFWYGVALDQQGDFDRAVEQFETAIALYPDYADALNYLAYIFALREVRLDDALRYIQNALAVDPDNAAYLDTLGWIYYKQGRLEPALEYLRRADQLRPDDPEIKAHIQEVLDAIQNQAD